MNVQSLTTQEQAWAALRHYRENRAKWDRTDAEIARIYRLIANGRQVISLTDTIRRGGIGPDGYPRLAVMRADQKVCRLDVFHDDRVIFSNDYGSKAREWHFEIPWAGRSKPPAGKWWARAMLPRIPPQHRPADLGRYQTLFEANWHPEPPRDPMLLKRIGRDSYLVLACWELSDVELSVLRGR